MASRIERYVPTVGLPDWDIKTADKGFRSGLKTGLRMGMVTQEADYQHVIAYMYAKFPHEMDLAKLPDGSANVPIQWRYNAGKGKVPVRNYVIGSKQAMYAFILYDTRRDDEPVAFAGSFFTIGKPESGSDPAFNAQYLVDANGNQDPTGLYQHYGNGYVMFVDPAYRRLGLGTDLWYAEAKLYQEQLNIRWQRDVQNEFSLISTQNMFSSPEKCVITSQGRLKNDGTRAQIRVLLDYSDPDVHAGYEELPENLRDINGHAGGNERFMLREAEKFAPNDGLIVERLERIWKAGKVVQ